MTALHAAIQAAGRRPHQRRKTMTAHTQGITSQIEGHSYPELWGVGNDKGWGFGIGDENHTVEEALAADGYAILDWSSDGEHVLAERGSERIICADANGPWAITVEPALIRAAKIAQQQRKWIAHQAEEQNTISALKREDPSP